MKMVAFKGEARIYLYNDATKEFELNKPRKTMGYALGIPACTERAETVDFKSLGGARTFMKSDTTVTVKIELYKEDGSILTSAEKKI